MIDWALWMMATAALVSGSVKVWGLGNAPAVVIGALGLLVAARLLTTGKQNAT